jgi:hypothetical protein
MYRSRIRGHAIRDAKSIVAYAARVPNEKKRLA